MDVTIAHSEIEPAAWHGRKVSASIPQHGAATIVLMGIIVHIAFTSSLPTKCAKAGR